eukprot:TRINITY_DN1335_c0_g2_i1.p1 TRINITY_DN1335_c0_g2~~TRINITY_DN1335_c0_g2_i1.p1  ORF type:complete len:362 (+),score=124.05 TRINITY_DN1335_c0_g2_i1:58-1086(+)
MAQNNKFGESFNEDQMSYQDESPFSQNQLTAENKPRILLMGLRRSGKSSIQKVVFNKMSPNETIFLESTNKIAKNDVSNNSFIQFQVWDFPGQLDPFDSNFDYESMFSNCGSIVFIIDAQDEYPEALSKMSSTIKRVYQIQSSVKFEVFVHKVDGLSDEQKISAQREIQEQAYEDLQVAKLKEIELRFHLTSIYDHSIFEAFSKVVQSLVPQLPTLENLLNIFISNCRIEKAFLIDVVSKIYIATDFAAVDMQTYELCSDMIDIVIDISCIYGMKNESEPLGYDSESQAIIKLSNGMVLYLREVNKYLALVSLLRSENFEKHGLIDFNFQCFKKAIVDVFKK